MTFVSMMTPTVVDRAVSQTTYKPGWKFEPWQGFLRITAAVVDSTTGEPCEVPHIFPIPSYFGSVLAEQEHAESWILDCILLVERHEAAEFFAVGGRKVFYPSHGTGDYAPYGLVRAT